MANSIPVEELSIAEEEHDEVVAHVRTMLKDEPKLRRVIVSSKYKDPFRETRSVIYDVDN